MRVLEYGVWNPWTVYLGEEIWNKRDGISIPQVLNTEHETMQCFTEAKAKARRKHVL